MAKNVEFHGNEEIDTMGRVLLSKTSRSELGIETMRRLNSMDRRRKVDSKSQAKGAYGGTIGNVLAGSSWEKEICAKLL